jgi:hypothetical protein
MTPKTTIYTIFTKDFVSSEGCARGIVAPVLEESRRSYIHCVVLTRLAGVCPTGTKLSRTPRIRLGRIQAVCMGFASESCLKANATAQRQSCLSVKYFAAPGSILSPMFGPFSILLPLPPHIPEPLSSLPLAPKPAIHSQELVGVSLTQHLLALPCPLSLSMSALTL